MLELTPKRHESLKLELKTYGNRRIYPDFNRLKYAFVPKLCSIRNAESLHRDEQVFRWYQAFRLNNEYTDATLHTLYRGLCEYVRVCDEARVEPESKNGFECWEKYLVHRVRVGLDRANSARGKLSRTKTLLRIFDQPVDSWCSSYKLFRSELNPTRAFSHTELKQLLRILKALYYQLAEQISKNPALNIQAGPNVATAQFSYQGKIVKVHAAITKCFVAAYFLMAYYTWGNASSIRDMKVPLQADTDTGKWFSQSILKRRANRYVTLELGDSFSATVPKHGLKFIESLISLSLKLFPEERLLFYQCIGGKRQALCPGHIQATVNWLIQHFKLTADNGQTLRPSAKRFRATGASNYLELTGNSMETSLLLGNTPNTVSMHYSSGNTTDNSAQIQATALTLENALRCSDVADAKKATLKQMELEILPYEEFLSKYVASGGGKTAIGTACKDPLDTHGSRYRNKNAYALGDVSNLACADILNCFNCENQVIVEEVDDIWCLLSFRESLMDAKEDHISTSQFERNFGSTLKSIDDAILNISPKIRRLAERKLGEHGRHPIWPEHLNLIF